MSTAWTPELVTGWLDAMPFVCWDRLNRWEGGGLQVYGWIARADGRADFVLITFEGDGALGFTTSSAEWSEHISRLLHGGESVTHIPCERVEHVLPSVSWTTRAAPAPENLGQC